MDSHSQIIPRERHRVSFIFFCSSISPFMFKTTGRFKCKRSTSARAGRGAGSEKGAHVASRSYQSLHYQDGYVHDQCQAGSNTKLTQEKDRQRRRQLYKTKGGDIR